MIGRNTFLAFSILALAGCGLGRFDVSRDFAEEMVPGSPLGGLLGPISIPIPITIDLAAETEARHTGPVQHVRLEALSLTITATDLPPGDHDDFSFIDSIDIYLESTASGSSLPRQRVARAQSIAAGTTNLELATDATVDLKPYIEEGARLTANASGHAPPDDVSFDGHYTLGIEVL